MSKYQDRGIIKWAPFDALISYQDVLNTMRYERGKMEQPILLDDQYEILNQTIHEALITHKMLKITYYEDGYFKFIYGLIKRFNDLEKTLIFQEGFEIKIHCIMDASVDFLHN